MRSASTRSSSAACRADALPWLYIPLGILSLVIALAYGAALGRVAKARLFGVTLVTVGVLLVAEFLLLAAVPDVVPIAWLTVMAAGAIAATISWTVATSSLDVRQARRLFPVCTAAAIAGYLAGSLLAGPIAGAVGAAALIGLEGLLFAVAAAVIVRPRAAPRRSALDPATHRSAVDRGRCARRLRRGPRLAAPSTRRGRPTSCWRS